jgi:hypothetical protein
MTANRRGRTGTRAHRPRCSLLPVMAAMAAMLVACEPADDRERADQVDAAPAPAAAGPSLAAQMLELQHRHASLWFAAEAENWPLVDYMLHEIEELVEVIEGAHPTYRDVPVAEMLGEITLPVIEEMEDAAEAGDRATFVEWYHRFTDACNACHVAADRAVIVIQRPEAPPLTNLRYRP